MPTYLYEREDGTRFELKQRITEDSLVNCPDTGQKVKRIIMPAGVVFKGSGFYQTDYKPSSASSGSNASKASASGAGEAGSGASQSDSSSSTGDGSSSGDASCNGKGPQGGCGACS